jgi:hypothetical protein
MNADAVGSGETSLWNNRKRGFALLTNRQVPLAGGRHGDGLPTCVSDQLILGLIFENISSQM